MIKSNSALKKTNLEKDLFHVILKEIEKNILIT